RQHRNRGNDTPSLQLTATSYDSYDELVAKYPESKRICAQLEELGASVLHRVDATNIRESLVAAGAAADKFHSVVFNHPHCGEENVRRHQSLLSHFYASALDVLEENVSEDEDEEEGILLTLAEGQPERWQAVQRALSAGLKLHRQVDDVDNDDKFGVVYERKRHQNGKSFHQVTLHGERKKQASTFFIFRRQKDGEAVAPAVIVATAAPSEGSGDKKSRKRKAESELPLEFACTQCERSFKSAQGLRTHVHMVHELEAGAPKKTLLPCEFCDRTFKKEDARRQHQLAKHGKDPLIKPDWYEKQQAATSEAATTAEAAQESAATSTSSTTTEATAISTTSAEPQTCSICQLSFPTAQDLDSHWQKLQPRAAAKRKCATCSREFDEERALRQHQNFCSQRASS
ncbi:Zn-finger protein, partial [Phytophthora cinnamomi]|uniref:Zn-finger protein n=1 Tax=Phytophthora cinnamomi TaxID=4785 RepID=UPI00355AC7B5